MSELPLNQIICGDCKEVMKSFPADSIDLVVTSPPYWGLRDYGSETVRVWGGDPECQHEWGLNIIQRQRGSVTGLSARVGNQKRGVQGTHVDQGNFCSNCGAWRGSLGLEPHPQMFIDHLVEICHDIKRVLKKTGSFWLNLGDTYFGGGGGNYGSGKSITSKKPHTTNFLNRIKTDSAWLQPKQLLGMPWRVAIELQDQGWILRNSVIWHKPNHMPSSVKDRLTPSYEFFFFFVKARKYFFDLDSIRKPYSEVSIARLSQPSIMKQMGGSKQQELYGDAPGHGNRPADILKGLAKKYGGKYTNDIAETLSSPRARQSTREETSYYDLKGKNPGDLWKIPTYPFPAAHFATFPMTLIEPVIKSSCPQQICNKCGIPREEIYESKPPEGGYKFERNVGGRTDGFSSRLGATEEIIATRTLLGYSDCGCGAGFSPGVVLDPFCGSGTALRVARKFGRYFIGIDVKKEYCEMAERRVKRDRYKEIPENVVPLSEFQGNETSDVGVPPNVQHSGEKGGKVK